MMQQTSVVISAHAYNVIPGNGGALVSSKSTPGGWHVIKCGRCDCEGFTHRGKCSHTADVERLAAIEAARTAHAEAARRAEAAHMQAAEADAAAFEAHMRLNDLLNGEPVALPAPVAVAVMPAVVVQPTPVRSNHRDWL